MNDLFLHVRILNEFLDCCCCCFAAAAAAAAAAAVRVRQAVGKIPITGITSCL